MSYRFSPARVAVISSLIALSAAGIAANSAFGATLASTNTSSTVTSAIAPVDQPSAIPDISPPEHIVAPSASIVDPVASPASEPASLSPHMSLASLVSQHGGAMASEGELNCLATAVYFESKGEPLAGQLAVAQVVINRSHSGRFASTLCGVVKQPSQFSFVHHGVMPRAGDNAMWRTAVGVAQVAMKHLAESPAPGALYFHARRVSPGWGRPQVASVGHHIFYR